MSLLLLPVLLVVAEATTQEKLLTVLDSGKNLKIVENNDGSLDITILFSEDVLELSLQPTKRHSKVKTYDDGAHMHSLEHLGIMGMSGEVRLRQGGVTVEKGTASIIYDRDQETFSGNLKVGNRHFFIREDPTTDKMVFGERVNSSSEKVSALKKAKSGKKSIYDTNVSGQEEDYSYRRIFGYYPITDGVVCKMKVVVDHKLYKFWHRDVKYATKFAMGMVEGANEIYRNNGPLLSRDNFGGYAEQGWPVQFHLEDLFVTTDGFCETVNWNDYRCRVHTNHSELLVAFAQSEDFSGHCLGFLFTGCDLGIYLGFTFVSGACCSRAKIADSPGSFNTGFVAVHNATFQVPEYVLAHELGHALGSHHDEEPTNRHLMDPQVPRNVTESVEVFSNKSIQFMDYLLLRNAIEQADEKASNYTCLRRSWCFTGSTSGSPLVLTRTTTTTSTTTTLKTTTIRYVTKSRTNSFGLFFKVFLVLLVGFFVIIFRVMRCTLMSKKLASPRPVRTRINTTATASTANTTAQPEVIVEMQGNNTSNQSQQNNQQNHEDQQDEHNQQDQQSQQDQQDQQYQQYQQNQQNQQNHQDQQSSPVPSANDAYGNTNDTEPSEQNEKA